MLIQAIPAFCLPPGSGSHKAMSLATRWVCSVICIVRSSLHGLENEPRMVLHHLLQRPGSFWTWMWAAWQVLLRCLSKFGCKKTFDLHTDLANVIHMCGPSSPGLMRRVLPYEQTYERNQTRSPQLGSVSDSSPVRTISRSLPLNLVVSLSHRLSHSQPGQCFLS